MRPILVFFGCMLLFVLACMARGNKGIDTHKKFTTEQLGDANQSFQGTQWNILFGDDFAWMFIAAMSSTGWGIAGIRSLARGTTIKRAVIALEAQRPVKELRLKGVKNPAEHVIDSLKCYCDYPERQLNKIVRHVTPR